MSLIFRFSLLVILISTMLMSCGKRSSLPDLRESFKPTDNKINGGSFAYKMLVHKYRSQYIEKAEQDFTYINSMHTDGDGLYYCTASNIFMGVEEVRNMSSFVKAGNTVFLAAKNLDSTLLDELFTSAENTRPATLDIPLLFDNSSTQLVPYGVPATDTLFSYYYLPFRNHFNEVNYSNYKVLGRNSAGEPNFLVYFWGKGKIFIHCDPAAISNYFLMSGKNYKYFEKVLSYLPMMPGRIYVDDYYCNKNYKEGEDDKSLLGMIFSRPALAWAFSILLGAFLLYLVINLKRQQRITGFKKPIVNDSVNFVEAITTLYYKKKDNKNIAEKMISYFYDDLKSKYFISNTQMSQDLVEALSHKSGMGVEDARLLLYNIKMVNDSAVVSDQQLQELNTLIYKFKHLK